MVTDDVRMVMSSPQHTETHLLTAVRTAADAIVSADAEGRITAFNPAAEQIFGRSAVDAIGQPLTILMPARFHLLHQAGFARFLRTGRSQVMDQVLSLTGMRADGSEFPLELSLSAWREHGAIGFTAVMRDIAERKRVEAFADCERAVTAVLATNPGLDEALPRLLAVIARHVGWQAGAIWTPDPEFAVLSLEAFWAQPDIAGEFEKRCYEATFAADAGVPGRVWASGEPATAEDPIVDVALPLHDGSELIGVIEFFSTRALPVDPGLLDLFGSVGKHIAQFIVRSRYEAARARAEGEMKRSEERFRVLATLAPAAIIETDVRGECLFVNDRWCELTGIDAPAALGDGWIKGVHPDDRVRLLHEWATALERDGRLSSEYRYVRADGAVSWVLGNHVALRDTGGTVTGYLASCVDITDRKNMEQYLRELADRDPLTHLLNRRGFARELHRQARLQTRYGPEGALLAIDIDRFKEINDRFGHPAGDDVLVRFAETLTRRLRQSDVIARVGGDEFAVILPRAGADEAEAVAASVVEAVRADMSDLGGNLPAVTASVGIALFERDDLTGSRMLERADEAMYAAKAAGRNRFAVAAR